MAAPKRNPRSEAVGHLEALVDAALRKRLRGLKPAKAEDEAKPEDFSPDELSQLQAALED